MLGYRNADFRSSLRQHLQQSGFEAFAIRRETRLTGARDVNDLEIRAGGTANRGGLHNPAGDAEETLKKRRVC